MKRRPRLTAALLAAALVPGCGEPPPEDAIATYRGGAFTLEEVERLMREQGLLRRDLAGEALLAGYRRASEALVLRRRLLADLGDLDAAIEALGEAADLRRQSVLDLYRQEKLGGTSLQVTQLEVDDHWQEHAESFYRQGQRNLGHIFRRHEDSGDPGPTLELLASLRRRAEAGETFSALAEEHSQSETRRLGGRLGWIPEGRLPPAIEAAVFRLEEGEISEPIPLPGGAAIFKVFAVVRAKQFEKDEVGDLVIRRVAERKTRGAVDAVLLEREPPEGSLVLELPEIMTLLGGGSDDDTLLEIGDYSLTIGEMKRLLQEDARGFQGDWAPRPRERVEELYQRELQNQLLYLDALRSGFADLPAKKKGIEQRVRALGSALLLEREIEERMRRRLDASGAELERFFEENRFLYQSDLRLRIETLRVGVGAEASAAAAAMERLRERLEAGELDISEAAVRLGGRVVDGGWVSAEELAAFEPKVRFYLLQLGGPGYSQPFQLNDFLQMIRVREWQEPHPLPYEEVEEKVRAEYLERHQQRLYREVAGEVLAAVDFRFHEDRLRQALGLADPQSPSSSP